MTMPTRSRKRVWQGEEDETSSEGKAEANDDAQPRRSTRPFPHVRKHHRGEEEASLSSVSPHSSPTEFVDSSSLSISSSTPDFLPSFHDPPSYEAPPVRLSRGVKRGLSPPSSPSADSPHSVKRFVHSAHFTPIAPPPSPAPSLPISPPNLLLHQLHVERLKRRLLSPPRPQPFLASPRPSAVSVPSFSTVSSTWPVSLPLYSSALPPSVFDGQTSWASDEATEGGQMRTSAPSQGSAASDRMQEDER